MAYQADVLVIGAGLAGGIAALQAAKMGCQVVVVHKGEPATRWAQGGIVLPESSAGLLINDILEAGCHKNYHAAVIKVVEQGRRAVNEWLIDELQVPFDKDSKNQFELIKEAAHSRERILHVKDHSGEAIYQKLIEKLRQHKNIQLVEGSLVDLLLSNKHDQRYQARFGIGRVCGAYVYKFDKTVQALSAKAVVLASGGFSQLFQHATGPEGACGEGISAAHRAGARTLHLEYIQFHPTALYVPGERRYLLTEALRGAGAKLLNIREQSFVNELAPRDVVSRAIHEEMLKFGSPHVWLDLRHLVDFETHFPMIHQLLLSKGLDPKKQLIPVVPAAHYTIGGVWTDLHGSTNVPGLFAAGEVACTGLHGANRLASTSLLEALVFGEEAGRSAAEFADRLTDDFYVRPWVYQTAPVDPALIQQDWNTIRQTMWNYVGLVRSERRLRRAEKSLTELRNEIERFYSESELSVDLIGVRHAILLANLVLYAALKNRESVGTHYLAKDS